MYDVCACLYIAVYFRFLYKLKRAIDYNTPVSCVFSSFFYLDENVRYVNLEFYFSTLYSSNVSRADNSFVNSS